MTVAPPVRGTACHIAGPMLVEAREFKTFTFPLVGAATTDLPAPPGAVQRDAAGRATLLHCAPGRVLAPAPTPDMVRHLEALAAAGVGALFDVCGKWRAIEVAGAGATVLLASGIDVAAVLARRECAALLLFDCPVVLARAAGGFGIWVQGSYASDFLGSLERIRGRPWLAHCPGNGDPAAG